MNVSLRKKHFDDTFVPPSCHLAAWQSAQETEGLLRAVVQGKPLFQVVFRMSQNLQPFGEELPVCTADQSACR